MSATPEHDKVEAARTRLPFAADLAHLMLAGDGWELVNTQITPPVRVDIRALVVELLNIDFEAYQAERVANMGITSTSLAAVQEVIRLSDEQRHQTWATIDDIVARLRDRVAQASASDVAARAVLASPIAAAAADATLARTHAI